jgi:ribonuclease PH
MTNSSLRADGRRPDQHRPVSLLPDIAPAATGSVLIGMGQTRVICGVSIEESVPGWMKAQGVTGGWITAEYSLLPYSTTDRARREGAKPSGRTMEIQRLIGRSLRAAVDLEALGSRTIWIDCDVLQADGGTRTAAITGAWIALRRAVDGLLAKGALPRDPIINRVAAISVGLVAGTPCLDLCYTEDVDAETDMNVVMTGDGQFIEVQGTAESRPFSPTQLQALLDLAGTGIRSLCQLPTTAR